MTARTVATGRGRKHPADDVIAPDDVTAVVRATVAAAGVREDPGSDVTGAEGVFWEAPCDDVTAAEDAVDDVTAVVAATFAAAVSREDTGSDVTEAEVVFSEHPADDVTATSPTDAGEAYSLEEVSDDDVEEEEEL